MPIPAPPSLPRSTQVGRKREVQPSNPKVPCRSTFAAGELPRRADSKFIGGGLSFVGSAEPRRATLQAQHNTHSQQHTQSSFEGGSLLLSPEATPPRPSPRSIAAVGCVSDARLVRSIDFGRSSSSSMATTPQHAMPPRTERIHPASNAPSEHVPAVNQWHQHVKQAAETPAAGTPARVLERAARPAAVMLAS
eukprot:5530072-Prymnesium_polylepis.1